MRINFKPNKKYWPPRGSNPGRVLSSHPCYQLSHGCKFENSQKMGFRVFLGGLNRICRFKTFENPLNYWNFEISWKITFFKCASTAPSVIMFASESSIITFLKISSNFRLFSSFREKKWKFGQRSPGKVVKRARWAILGGKIQIFTVFYAKIWDFQAKIAVRAHLPRNFQKSLLKLVFGSFLPKIPQFRANFGAKIPKFPSTLSAVPSHV